MGSFAPRRLPVSALLAVLLTACSEEDRRAWVSILPLTDRGRDGEEASAGAGLALSADSTAVLLAGDTLLTVRRLPARGPEGADLSGARFAAVALSPDARRVAFATAGASPVVGVWTRARQTAGLTGVPADAGVDRVDWAPGGRFVAWQGRTRDGPTTVGAYDARADGNLRHPVLQWLAERGRSAWLQDWVDDSRLRVLVGAGLETVGGLAFVWELGGGSFVHEAHLPIVVERAPSDATLVPGGLFSLDLLDDPAPETVVLYFAAGGAPGALVLRSRGDEHRAVATEPLAPMRLVGVERWEELELGPRLADIVDLGGRPTLLIELPSRRLPGRLVALFVVGEDGRLAILPVEMEAAGERPAVFYDGQAADRVVDLVLLDLDGDGGREVVSVVGRPDTTAAGAPLAWEIAVYRHAAGRLVAAPELEPEAREVLRRPAAP